MAPLLLVSSASATPIRLTTSRSQPAARQEEAGKQAARTPPWNWAPLAPFGPSETFAEGIPSLLIGTVSQKFFPANNEIFSSRVSCFRSWSTSTSVLAEAILFVKRLKQ